MATNNGRNNKGQFPIGSIVRLDFAPPAGSGWLECDGSAVSQTTYAELYSVIGNEYSGTASLTEVAGDSTAASSYQNSLDWHPSSNYVALASGKTSSQVIICSFNGSTLTEVETVNTGDATWNVDWHPNGNFLATTSDSGNIRIYSWNGSDTLTGVEIVDTGGQNQDCDWHPSGSYIATCADNYIKVYSWNGSDTLTEVESVSLGAASTRYKWSNNGNYLAVGSSVTDNYLRVYEWNGTDTLTLKDTYDNGNVGIMSFDWTLNDDFLFFGQISTTKTVVALSFDGTNLSEVDYIGYGASYTRALTGISKCGNYLFTVTCNQTTATTQYVYAYSINLSTGELTEVDSISKASSYGFKCINVNYTNNYIAYSNSTAASDYVMFAGTTGLTSCDYRTNFPLPNITDSIIRSS